MDYSQLKKPALLFDEDRCRKNIRAMVDKAARHRVELNPHFKTHQSRIIGSWFREEGIGKITVSSLRMARYFYQDGWEDITIAFPVNIRQSDQLDDLAANINLTLFVNNLVAAQQLDQHLSNPVHVYTEIDTGYQRTGIPHKKLDAIERLLDHFEHSEWLEFKGFYTHAGQTYDATDNEQIAEIHSLTLHRLNRLKKRLSGKYPDIRISIGDTPSCSISQNFAGVHSIHPGNFVFYDLNQFRISSCSIDQIAVALACPVVSRRPERRELILHGGAVHLSKQFELTKDQQPYYGLPVTLETSGWSGPWSNSHLRSLSQEHGILKCNKEQFNAYEVGDLVGILPIHACLTCNLMGHYVSLENEQIDHMEEAAYVDE